LQLNGLGQPRLASLFWLQLECHLGKQTAVAFGEVKVEEGKFSINPPYMTDSQWPINQISL